MNSTANLMPTRVSALSIATAISLMLFGLLAILLPVLPGIAIIFLLGCVVLFAGLVQLLHTFQSRGVGSIVWNLLVSACYLIAGLYLFTHPVLGLAGLTLTLAAFFVAIGAVDVVAFLVSRKTSSSAWLLVNGIILLGLGAIIWSRWPASSLWFVGTLLGFGMLVSGITRLMMALASRKPPEAYGELPSHRWAA